MFSVPIHTVLHPLQAYKEMFHKLLRVGEK